MLARVPLAKVSAMARCRVRVRDVQPHKDVDTGSMDTGSSLPSCLSLFLSYEEGQSTPKPSLLGTVKFNVCTVSTFQALLPPHNTSDSIIAIIVAVIIFILLTR